MDQGQLRAFRSHGPITFGIFILFALSASLAAVLGFKTVFPTVNPSRNVSFPDNLEPKFFISAFSCCRIPRLFSGNPKFAMLKETHAHYCESLREATGEKLESIAAAEVLKLSFIRQMKTDRLAAFAKVLTSSVILFLVLNFIAPKEVSETSAIADHKATEPPMAQVPQNIYNYWHADAPPVPNSAKAPVGTDSGHHTKRTGRIVNPHSAYPPN